MRLPRNSKIFRGQLDVAPFAGVSFLLLLFLVLESKLVFTPGIRIDLPEATRDLPGTPEATVVVAVDGSGQIYYESQAVASLAALRERLSAAVAHAKKPPTLEVRADKATTSETITQLLSLAGEVGMRGALWVARPPVKPVGSPTHE